jgi:biofilm PGA synthesis lipoprotein PgaB
MQPCRNLIRGAVCFAVCLLIARGDAGATQRKASPLPQVNAKVRGQYVAVLMWHDVVPSHKEVWFDTTVAELQAQFAAIRRGKFHVLAMDQLIASLTQGTPLPPRSLVLTFDDNNQGLYDNAFPLLKQYHYPATFFVHTNYVGVTTSKAHCDWPTLLKMQQSGLVRVQGHSGSHPPDMRLLSDAENLTELGGSKALIEKHLSTPCDAFSYPEGHFDDHVAHLVAAAGYKVAFTEDWGSATASRNLFLVHRYSIHKRFAQALRDVAAAWPQK